MVEDAQINRTDLNRTGVEKAVAALCEVSTVAGTALKKGVVRLLLSEAWASEMDALSRLGLTVQYASGALSEILSLPGDLILVRLQDKSYRLLHYEEGRWSYLAENGEPLQFDPDDDGELEAVAFCMPSGSEIPGGFASLVALWPRLRAAWAEVGVASLFANAGQLLLPLFAMLIYDKVALNGLFETLWALVFGMGLYLATDAGMRLVRSWTTERISVEQTRLSDESLWRRMVAQADLPPGGFPRFMSNYRDLAQSRDFVSSSYLLQVADIPFFLLYLTVIGIIAWQMMVVVLLLALLYAAIGMAMQLRQTRLSKEAEQLNTQKLAFMGEALNSLDVVRTTPGAKTFLRSWRALSQTATESDTRKRLAAHQTTMLASMMQTLTTVIILTTGVYLIYGQMMTIGKLIACNILAGRAMAQVASLFSVASKWQDFTRAAARMEASLEHVDEHSNTPRPEIEGNIAVLGLGKHYEGRPAALEKVTFRISPGERIALLGRPGAGKSTLLRCLAGLSRADAGKIQIDGLELEDIAPVDRVRWLSYKGQDPVVFAGTLEENLRISGDVNQERFNKAIWTSGLDVELSSGRMSLGMDLAERGSNLSGGQRQKVALTRALAQPSRILLLDEPTLGLDPESERLLAQRLPQLLEEKTVLIMTTHSPTMLGMVQRVIALDEGKVVADGPREKLIKIAQG